MISYPTFAHRITAIALGSVLCVSVAAQPQDDETQKRQAPEVVTVTGSRTASAVSELPTSVSVLDVESLSQQFTLSTDLLRALDFKVPGLNASTGARSQCSTKIRGRTPGFQINGVPANQDLRPSNCNSAFQLSPFAIERVEVVRGATSLFGAGAPGGIVNLITRQGRSEEPHVDLVAQTSASSIKTENTWQHDFYVGAGEDRGIYDYYVGYGRQHYGAARDPNGAYTPATEFVSDAFNTSVGLELSKSVRLRFTGTHYAEDPGQEYNVNGAEVNSEENPAFPSVIVVENNPFRHQAADGQTTAALSLDADDLLGHTLNTSVFYQRQEFKQRANFQDYNGGEPDFFSDDRRNSTLGFRATLGKTFAFGADSWELQYGVDVQRNRLVRLRLDPQNPQIAIGFIAPEVIFDTRGLFVQNEYVMGDFRFSGGVRKEFYSGEIGDAYTHLGVDGQGTPGDFASANLDLFNAGAIYELSAGTQLYVSYNQGAEITQLGRAARRATNPGLISPEPAKSDQVELGARGRQGDFEFSSAVFYSESDLSSQVQPDPNCPEEESFCPLIPLRVPQRVHGVEGTATYYWSSDLETGAVLTWQKGEIFNEEAGEYIPFDADTVSPTRIAIYADWQAWRQLTLNAQASYTAASQHFSPAQTGLGLVQTDSVFLADLSAAYVLPRGTLNLGISNVFNEDYVNVTAAAAEFLPTLAEGRRVTLAYKLQL